MYDTTFTGDDLRGFLQQLARSSGLLEPRDTHEHAGVRLSVSETFALGELIETGGGLSQQELASRLGLEKSTVSRLAAGMEDRGWITREREGRLVRLQLTDAGRDVGERIGAELREHHGRLLAHLTATEREALGIGLNALTRALAEAHP